MPATKEITIYKYGELSESAQQKAREWYIEGMDYEWWEGVYESAKEEGLTLGFHIDTINFSGFWSQGDGARWVGQIDVVDWLKAHAPDTIGVSALIALINEGWIGGHVAVRSTASNYSHENTMDVGELYDVDDRLIDSDDFDEAELMTEYIEGQGIFDGMTLANIRDLINTDEANPYKLSNLAALDEAIETSAKDYAKDIYIRLREEYEYLCSEEMMLDHFEANDYHFTEEGALA